MVFIITKIIAKRVTLVNKIIVKEKSTVASLFQLHINNNINIFLSIITSINHDM